MKRHRFDPLSFSFGVAFLAIAAIFSFEGIDVHASVMRWIVAGALLLFGVLMLVTSRARSGRP